MLLKGKIELDRMSVLIEEICVSCLTLHSTVNVSHVVCGMTREVDGVVLLLLPTCRSC